MANKSPAFQFYPGDHFLSDANVASMTFEERGIYMTLLCHCWIEGSLPVTHEELLKLLPGYKPKYNIIPSQITTGFKRMRGNSSRLISPLLEKERLKQAQWREKQGR